MEFNSTEDKTCGFHVEDAPLCIDDKETLEKITLHHNLPKASSEILKKHYNCYDELCVLEQLKDVIGADKFQKILKENFRPKGPKLTKEWLSNFDIDDVLKQMSKKYQEAHFYHIPFQMIDFQKTKSELAMLDWPTIYKSGKKTFGSVINTDLSTGSGQHWFAVYGDFLDESPQHTLEYFNSSGELPPNEIIYWCKKAQHAWQPHFKKTIKIVTATRIVNQFDNSSCGAYALYYIISRLSGVPYEYFKYNKIGDIKMVKFRKYLFR